MQRGQGRGRGRNPNPARTSSRSNIRSRSRHPSSQTNSRASLRRSARLAQLVNGDLDSSPENNSMADVARPQTTHRNGNVGRRHASSRLSDRPRSNPTNSFSPEAIQYEMDVVLQPPPTARAGHPLNRPIVVRLRTTNMDPDHALADSTNLVAVATLVPESNSTGSMDPAVLNTLLAGRRFDSVRPFSDDEADSTPVSIDMDDPHGVGYMYFSELTIRQAGTYRIRITLIRIRNSNSDPPVASASGGSSVQVVDSTPIVVRGSGPSTNAAPYNGDDEEDDGGWLEVLRTIQTRRRSRG